LPNKIYRLESIGIFLIPKLVGHYAEKIFRTMSNEFIKNSLDIMPKKCFFWTLCLKISFFLDIMPLDIMHWTLCRPTDSLRLLSRPGKRFAKVVKSQICPLFLMNWVTRSLLCMRSFPKPERATFYVCKIILILCNVILICFTLLF